MAEATFDTIGPWIAVRFRAPTLTDALKLSQIRDALTQRLDEAGDKPQVLISFKRVDAVSSQVIGLLLEVKQKVAAAKGKLVLTNLGTNVEHVLKLTRLDKQFEVHDSASKLLAPYISRKPGQAKGNEIDWVD